MTAPDTAHPPLPAFSHPTSFRLGVTSYVYPADVLTNVTALAGRVADIELVYFESRDASNMPTAADISALRGIAATHDLTFTVHLPTDIPLGCGASIERDLAVSRALKLIELTASLRPHSYILHLDGISASDHAARVREWQGEILPRLRRIVAAAPAVSPVCVENLDYPFAWCDPLLDAVQCGVCTDAGHLWETGADWRQHLVRYLPRTRVIHLYGPNGSIHQALNNVPREQTAAFLSSLGRFAGVLTLETFGYDDTRLSVEALSALLANRPAGAWPWTKELKPDEA